MSRARRGDLLVGLGLAAVVLGLFRQWLAAPGETLYSPWSDVVVQFAGWKAFMARAAEGPGIAFWNPSYFCGTPAYANPQYLWAHPLHLLFHIMPVDQAVAPTFALYLVLIGWGTHVWLRLCGLDGWSAGLGALAGVLAPRLLYHVAGGFLPYLLGVTLLPWAFAATEYACRRPTAWRWGLVAFALALQVSSGFVQIWLYGGYALAVYVLLRPVDGWRPAPAATPSPLAPSRNPVPVPLQRLAALAAAYVASLALAAYHFWPAYVFSQQTTRGGALALDRVTDVSVTGWHWLTAVVPQPWGDPSRMLAVGGGRWLLWEQSVAFGMVPLLLLFVGRRSAYRRLWFVLGGVLLLSLAFAWGAGNPFFAVLYRLPGIARFRFPVRFLFVAGVALSGLTAAGVHALFYPPTRGGASARPFLVVALVAAGWCAVLQWTGWVWERDAAAAMLRPAFIGLWWLPLLAVALAVLARAGACSPRTGMVAGILALLMTGDTVPATAWTVRMADPDLVYPRNAVIQELQDTAGVDRVADLAGAVHKGMPGRVGLQIPDGYDPLQLAHTVRYMRALTGDAAQGTGNDIRLMPVRAPRLFALLGAPYVVDRQARLDNLEPIRTWSGVETFQFWQGVGTIPGRATLFRYRDALPRAFVVGPARHVTVTDEERELASFEPTAEVLLADAPPLGGSARFAAADIVDYTPNRVAIRATSDAAGYLVLTDAWYPAWRATRNGEAVDVLRADGMFRAVPLPAAGNWTVEFRYRPTAEAWGAAVTGVALVALGALGVRARRRA